jgi:hypothetical protein
MSPCPFLPRQRPVGEGENPIDKEAIGKEARKALAAA